jgi:hypothetical protein
MVPTLNDISHACPDAMILFSRDELDQSQGIRLETD